MFKVYEVVVPDTGPTVAFATVPVHAPERKAVAW